MSHVGYEERESDHVAVAFATAGASEAEVTRSALGMKRRPDSPWNDEPCRARAVQGSRVNRMTDNKGKLTKTRGTMVASALDKGK